MTSTDPRFDQAEGQVEYGKSWRFREEDAPNPLTLEVTGWSLDVPMPNGDLVDFMRGVDREGQSWSVLVGGAVLKQNLVEGRVEKWNEEKEAFEVVETLGRANPGDIVSMKYTGDQRAKKSGNDYPTFRISRIAGDGTASVADTPPPAAEQAETAAAAAPADGGDDIPF